ncbi:MAG: penicillin acylase family protein [Vulcanimicrobiota bacterium]
MHLLARRTAISFTGALLLIWVLLIATAWAENVKIVRDEYGVPHVYATTDDALFFGQGYAMAEDRLFQLEMCRLAASGRLSSVLGEKYLEYDQVQRRDIYNDLEIQKMYLTLPEEQKKVYNAFAAGINQYIKDAKEQPDRKLSIEFHKAKMEPVKWKGEDVIRVYLNSFHHFFEYGQELENAALYKFALDKFGEVEGKNVFDDVVWKDDPGAPVTLPQWAPAKKEKTTSDYTPASPGIARIADNYARQCSKVQQTLMSLGVPHKAGSYAVAVSGKKTSTGNPMLLAGPQVGFGLPSFLYQISLHGKDIDCCGTAFIGIPGIIVGQNKDMAWGLTVGKENQVDFFKEKLNPKNQYQYWYKGKWVDMQKESYIIKIKDKKDIVSDVYKTVHGPVVSWDMKDTLNPVAYSKNYSYKENPLESWRCSHRLLKARNSDEFFNATRTSAYSLNWVSIDRKGDISYIHTGIFPIRAAEVDLRLPTDGTGKCDWKGFMNASDLPQGKNPPENFLVTWNSKPAREWLNGELSTSWGVQNRTNLFLSLLRSAELREISFQDLKNIDEAISTTNVYAPEIKPLLLAALETHTDPDIKAAAEQLRYWDNRYTDQNRDGYCDSPGALVFDLWWENLIPDLFADSLSEYKNMSWNGLGASLVLRVLKKEEVGGMALHHDFLNGRDTREIMAGSLKKAVTKIKEKYGNDPSKWLKKADTLDLSLRMARLGDLPFSCGEKLTLPYQNRGSVVLIVEASKIWVKGVDAMPPGESGFVSKDGKASSHLKDQLNLYIDRKYKDMLFCPEDVQHHTESEKVLEYNGDRLQY